jgi:nucleoside-diphosphate-sugar epimerase
MKILVTGNLGYIGSILTQDLIDRGYEVVGFDTGYFKDCNLLPVAKVKNQILKDIRKIEEKDMESCEAVIHLAALSNDPLGEINPKITEEINLGGTTRLAEIAKKIGIKRFVNVSTQSIYGISNTEEELDEYNSIKNPVTEYAKTKWRAEVELSKLNSRNFNIISFRPSTVFGMSPRLRCDIVFNNLIACAYTKKIIEIKSDGSPWRPVVHIKDVCNSLIAGLEAPSEIISGRVFNVGLMNGNYTVKQLAEFINSFVENSRIIFTNEHNKDSRTYKVSFNRINKELKSFYKPQWNLRKGAEEMLLFFKKINFTEDDFKGSKTNRLLYLKNNLHILN